MDWKQALAALAADLHTTADKLWQVLIDQAFVFGVFNLGTWVLMLLLTVVGGVLTARWKSDEYDRWPLPRAICLVVTLLFGLFVLVSGTTTDGLLYPGFTALCNPEYWALQQILNAL